MRFRHAALALATAALLSTSFISTGYAAEDAPTQLKAESENKEVLKRFDKWSTRCLENSTTKNLTACHAFVDVRIEENKQQLLYVGIGYIPNEPNNFFMFATTPLGTVLTPGVGMTIDDKEKMGGPYVFCIPVGCQADIRLSDAQLKSLKNGKVLTATFQLIGKGPVKVPIELDGFTAAVNSLPKPTAKAE
jgi:invasion protein IalB